MASKVVRQKGETPGKSEELQEMLGSVEKPPEKREEFVQAHINGEDY